MAGGGDSTLVGVAAVIAALASLVSAVASFWTNRKVTKLDATVKKNGNGGKTDAGTG